MVIRRNLINLYLQQSENRGLNSYRLPILLLRLDKYVLFYIFSYLLIVPVAEFMGIYVNLYLILAEATPKSD